MGQEINPTTDFKDQLKMAAKTFMMQDSNRVVRIHAGESAYCSDNILNSLKIIKEARNELQSLPENQGKTFAYPEIRIGHGIHGVTDEVLKLAKEMNAIIEINTSSNFALNNIFHINSNPIKRYVDSGVKVVIGTDGPGMYDTSVMQEAILAKRAGLTDEDFLFVRETEKQCALRREKIRPIELGQEEVLELAPLKTENKTFNIPESCSTFAYEDFARAHKDKRPIYIDGTFEVDFEKLSPEQRKDITEKLTAVVNASDPEKCYFITSGLKGGISGLLSEIIHNANKANGKHEVACLLPKSLKGAELPPVTSVITSKKYVNIFDTTSPICDLLFENSGSVVIIGGTYNVTDILQTAHNRGIDLHLDESVLGASSEKAEQLKSYGFKTSEELLHGLKKTQSEVFNLTQNSEGKLHYKPEKTETSERIAEANFTPAMEG